ncbi:hypothetical protein T439DRAFT_356744 [Meredithblackwellia eburnea MCA 4105]
MLFPHLLLVFTVLATTSRGHTFDGQAVSPDVTTFLDLPSGGLTECGWYSLHWVCDTVSSIGRVGLYQNVAGATATPLKEETLSGERSGYFAPEGASVFFQIGTSHPETVAISGNYVVQPSSAGSAEGCGAGQATLGPPPSAGVVVSVTPVK